jgi:hypothetical protein
MMIAAAATARRRYIRFATLISGLQDIHKGLPASTGTAGCG